MKNLKDHVRKYLELRRGLGYKLRPVETKADEFVTFLERKGAAYITERSV